MEDQMIAYAEEFTLENVTNMEPGIEGHAKEFNASLICRNPDDLLKSRVTATVHAFLNACAPKSETILPDSWNLCTPPGVFHCEDVLKYTSLCRIAKESCRTSTEFPPSCGLYQMVDQTGAILLLVGILMLGILIGIASTVAVCLICPKIHSWMLSKLQTKAKVSREYSVDTDYTDIDDTMIEPCPGYPNKEMVLYSVSNSQYKSSKYIGIGCGTGNILLNSGQKTHCEQLEKELDCKTLTEDNIPNKGENLTVFPGERTQ